MYKKMKYSILVILVLSAIAAPLYARWKNRLTEDGVHTTAEITKITLKRGEADSIDYWVTFLIEGKKGRILRTRSYNDVRFSALKWELGDQVEIYYDPVIDPFIIGYYVDGEDDYTLSERIIGLFWVIMGLYVAAVFILPLFKRRRSPMRDYFD